jgi:serine/threonine-protein kinase
MLGEGGASKVYLAEQLNIQRKCAIKCIDKRQEAYGLLKNEYMLIKQLEHVGIPRIYDVEEDDKNLYIIEEYICGMTLVEFLNSNSMTEKESLDVILQLCNIIEYLHTVNDEPIIYQDLKPDNIIICNNNLVKLIDFGSAITKSELKNQKVRGITSNFAAPELFTNKPIDHRADIYSIGKILEYIIKNNSINISNSTNLIQIIKGCLEESPSDRFPNIKSVISNIHEKITEISSNHLSKTICVLGSQRRIGTTYTSLIVAKALERIGHSVLVRENNSSTSFDHLLERNNIKLGGDNSYMIKGIHLQPASIEGNQLENYQYIVEDCGEINSERIPKADFYIIVMGTREWELCYTEKLIVRLNKVTNSLYVFNLTTDTMFSQIKYVLGKRCCIQMPYIKNPFKLDKGFIKEIMEGLDKLKYQI